MKNSTPPGRVMRPLLLLLLLLVTACAGKESEPVTDCEGRSYRTVTIGNRVWTAENLDVSRYRNGDPIPEVRDPEEWAKLKTGAWCRYENDDAKGKIYGRLYNWYAVNDPRGLAPRGWHVATDADWKALGETLGGQDHAGGALKATRLWKETDDRAGKSGLDILPAGARRDTDGAFVLAGEYSRLWSSTESAPERAWGYAIGYFDAALRRGEASKRLGFAVRCVKD
ncbi:MAG: hypothetical protein HGA58_06715 [Chlorobiaceae bacterium]|nr:hypothetical protein [Chlorobiaceae bacterium]